MRPPQTALGYVPPNLPATAERTPRLSDRGQQCAFQALLEEQRAGIDRSASVETVRVPLAAAVRRVRRSAEQSGLRAPSATEIRLKLLGAHAIFLSPEALRASEVLGGMDGSEAHATERLHRTGAPGDLAISLVEFAERHGVCPALLSLHFGRSLSSWTVAVQTGHGLGLGGLCLLEALGSWSVERLCQPDGWSAIQQHAGVRLGHERPTVTEPDSTRARGPGDVVID